MKNFRNEDVIICITDGYHEQDYYFCNGNTLHGEENFINLLCEPHGEHYVLFTIYYEDFDEEINTCIFLESFEVMNRKSRIANFEKLIKIYTKMYQED